MSGFPGTKLVIPILQTDIPNSFLHASTFLATVCALHLSTVIISSKIDDPPLFFSTVLNETFTCGALVRKRACVYLRDFVSSLICELSCLSCFYFYLLFIYQFFLVCLIYQELSLLGCRELWTEIAPLLSGSCTLPGRVDGQPWFSSIS